MAGSELQEITQRALAQYAKLDLPERAVMIVAEPPQGTSFWPETLEQNLFKGKQDLAKDWRVGEFVKGTTQLVLANDEATWNSVADLGAGLMRAIASCSRQERIALATTPVWNRVDVALTPIADGERDGLPIDESPRYVMAEGIFRGPWAAIVIQQILSGSKNLPTTERWLERDDKPVKYDTTNNEHTWWYSTPISIAAAVADILTDLASAWSETTPKSAPTRDAVVIPDQRDQDGYVIKPLDEKGYISKAKVLSDHCGGTGLDTDKKLTRALEKCKQTVRQWRPRSNRLSVHLADWLSHLEKIKQNAGSDEAFDPSPEEIERSKLELRDKKTKKRGGE